MSDSLRPLDYVLLVLYLAAFVAALMSSIDSYLNSASVIVTNDLYKRFVDRAASQRRLMVVGRLVTVALVVWAVAFAFFMIRRSEGIYAVVTMLGLRPLFQVHEPFLYFSVWAFLVSAGLVIVISLATPAESDEKLRYVLGGQGGSEA